MKTMKTAVLKNIVASILERHNGLKVLSRSYPTYSKRIENIGLDRLTDRQITILYNRFEKIYIKNDEMIPFSFLEKIIVD